MKITQWILLKSTKNSTWNWHFGYHFDSHTKCYMNFNFFFLSTLVMVFCFKIIFLTIFWCNGYSSFSFKNDTAFFHFSPFECSFRKKEFQKLAQFLLDLCGHFWFSAQYLWLHFSFPVEPWLWLGFFLDSSPLSRAGTLFNWANSINIFLLP